MTLVSVVISNYNYAQYITEAVESVMNQTYKVFEIIIVNDGSQDNSLDIINGLMNKYQEKIILINQENKGQAASFNRAYEIAKGDIIAFLDADDYWYPRKLETIIQKHQDYAAIQHNLLINNVSKFTFLADGICKQQQLLEQYVFMGTIPTSGLSFLKEKLRNVFPIPEAQYKICADLYMKIMYLNDGDILSLDEALGCYRVHDLNNWYNSQFSSIEYNTQTLDLLNKRRFAQGKHVLVKESEAITFANVFLNSMKLSKEEQYIIFGTGALGSEMYKLLKANYNIIAFSNSFVKEKAMHEQEALISISEIKKDYPAAKIIISSTQINEIVEMLMNENIHSDQILIPRL